MLQYSQAHSCDVSDRYGTSNNNLNSHFQILKHNEPTLHTLLYQPSPFVHISELPYYKAEGQIYFPYDVMKAKLLWSASTGTNVVTHYMENLDSRHKETTGQSTNGNGGIKGRGRRKESHSKGQPGKDENRNELHWFELEESTQNWVEDVLSFVDKRTQGLREEMNTKIDT